MAPLDSQHNKTSLHEHTAFGPIQYCVITEERRVVYRGTSLEQCAIQLKPGRSIGNIFGKGETQAEAELNAMETLNTIITTNNRLKRLKAQSE